MKAAIAITLALVAASASTQEIRFEEQVKFGDEIVTLNITEGTTICDQEERVSLRREFHDETESFERERLAQQLLYCGDGESLWPLSQEAERRSDLVSAYAHMNLLGEYAKLNAKRGPPAGQDEAWDKVQLQSFYPSIHKEVARLDKLISAEQRKAAIKQAAALFSRLAKSTLPAARLLVRDDGRPWAHSDWDQLVRQAATKAKLPKGVCLYVLRHSFITQALQDGMPTLDLARLVGTSLAMIDKHYGHLALSAARERLAKVQLL